MTILQDDLRDMLIALGLPDGTRPQSPHEVFRECIDAVKQLRAALPRLRAGDREEMTDLLAEIERQELTVAHSTDMTRHAMREGAMDMVNLIRRFRSRLLSLPAPPVAEPLLAEAKADDDEKFKSMARVVYETAEFGPKREWEALPDAQRLTWYVAVKRAFLAEKQTGAE